MSASTLSNLATQFTTNAAGVATAAAVGGGTVATADITALAALLKTMSLRSGDAIPLLNLSTTPALQTSMLNPG